MNVLVENAFYLMKKQRSAKIAGKVRVIDRSITALYVFGFINSTTKNAMRKKLIKQMQEFDKTETP